MTIDKQVLREAAEKAGKDEWQAKKINGGFYVIRCGSYRKQCGITSYQPIAEIDHKPVRDFVALANPATMLTLLDEVEAAEHTAAVDHEAACSLVEENEELKRRVAELEIESSVKDAVIIELKQQYSRLQEARYNTPAVRDVIAERQRQLSVEGWTPGHDDEYTDGQLAIAASCYALMGAREQCLSDGEYQQSQKTLPYLWPWDPAWWKPKGARPDLVRAGALIQAEIERIDRAAGIKVKG
ncbi:ead/Ea22-like family protein [Salmonella enterica]